MKLLTLLVTLPLVLVADPVGGCFPAPHPQPFPPGTTPEVRSFGCTPTGTWDAAYEPSQNGNGGTYYIELETYEGMLSGFTAQFTFPTASQDNNAVFGIVGYWGGYAHGTPEDPNNPDVISWDPAHQIETVTVPITQIDITEQGALITLPAGLTTRPQITFLDITSNQIQAVPEPGSGWLIALGIPGISLAGGAKGRRSVAIR